MAPPPSRLSAAAGILAGAMMLGSSGAHPDDRTGSGFAGIGVVYRGEADDLRLAIAEPSLAPGSKVVIVTVPDNRLLCCATVGIAYVLWPKGFDPVHLDTDGKATYALDAAAFDADVDLGFGIVDVPAETASAGVGRLDLDLDGGRKGFAVARAPRACT